MFQSDDGEGSYLFVELKQLREVADDDFPFDNLEAVEFRHLLLLAFFVRTVEELFIKSLVDNSLNGRRIVEESFYVAFSHFQGSPQFAVSQLVGCQLLG